jgi:hypothetical protein
VSTTPDDLAGESAAGEVSGTPIRVNLQVVWPFLDDFYLAPSLRPRPGFGGVAECLCDCGSKSGSGGGK